MRLHHLNCGSFCPLLGRDAVCHCLLIETANRGLVLIDTGIGDAVTRNPRRQMSRMNRWTLRPRFSLRESALNQLQQLGFEPEDVQHIVLTHLDVDHAGGLQDFPAARVHVHRRELDAASARRADPRYSPALWSHVRHWESYTPEGEAWYGLPAQELRGLSSEFAFVPLLGHTSGHSGVAVRAPDGGWLLHAGDAYLESRELLDPTALPWLARASVHLTSVDRRGRDQTLQRLRELKQRASNELDIFSAHCAEEYRALSARS